MSKCLGRDISVRQHSKSEHWAPCHIQTPSRYDWKRLKATLSPNQTNKRLIFWLISCVPVIYILKTVRLKNIILRILVPCDTNLFSKDLLGYRAIRGPQNGRSGSWEIDWYCIRVMGERLILSVMVFSRNVTRVEKVMCPFVPELKRVGGWGGGERGGEVGDLSMKL